MADRVGWGILGTGMIAHTFARGVRASAASRLAAVGSRSLQSAEAFARETGAPKAYGSYDELLADPDVDAVYISLPNHLHARWTVRAPRQASTSSARNPSPPTTPRP